MRSLRRRLVALSAIALLVSATPSSSAITRGTYQALGIGFGPYSVVVAADDTFLACAWSGPASGGATPSAVDYNGDAMTIKATFDFERVRWVATLANPDVGTHNLTITWSGTPDYVSAGCQPYKGATDVTGTAVTNFGGSGTATATVTVGAASSWLIGACAVLYGYVPTAGAGTDLAGLTADNYLGLADSNGAPGTGSKSLVCNGTGVAGAIAIELTATGGAPPPAPHSFSSSGAGN